MKKFKIIGTVLLIIALLTAFTFYAVAQDKKQDPPKKVIKKVEKPIKVNCPHATKEDCTDQKVKSDCPHSKTDKPFIKNVKKVTGTKVNEKCKEDCLSKCEKTGSKHDCQKECETKTKKEKK